MNITTTLLINSTAPLYHRYQGQNEAQPAYLVLDLLPKNLSVDWNAEIGSNVPMSVFQGHVLWFKIVNTASSQEYNKFLQDETIVSLCERIVCGYSYGEDSKAYFTEDARRAEMELCEYVEEWNPDNTITPLKSWSDWFVDQESLFMSLNKARSALEFFQKTEAELHDQNYLNDTFQEPVEWAIKYLIDNLDCNDYQEIISQLPKWILEEKEVAEIITNLQAE